MAAVLYRSTTIPVFDDNGNPVSGALSNWYLSGTLTRTPIYSDSALSIEHTNPVEANSSGVLPAIYLDSDIAYRVIITYADGVQISDTDPYEDLDGAAVLAKLLSVDGSGSGLDADKVRGTTPSVFGLSLIDDGDASTARTTLGLGTIATQAANNVAITGGAITGITDLAVADGGTGASTAANARNNLGLGTIATQAASAVTITGGSAALTDVSSVMVQNATALSVVQGGTSADALIVTAGGGSYSNDVISARANRPATTGFDFIEAISDADGTPDTEFRVGGTGVVASDGGTAMTTPADYAEMFEWDDGNPGDEDRVGFSVVLVGNMIRKAEAGEVPIGIISGNPAVCADNAWNRWSKKYLMDDFNRHIMEDYEVDGEVQQRRKLNPDFDPDQPYTPRDERPEWSPVGLMGKLRLRKGQPVASSWLKMRDISVEVEEWLVR